MYDSHARGAAHAFALPELAAVLLIVIVLAAVVLGGPNSRRRARLAGSIQNLQQIGVAGAAYGEDSAGRVWTFSWRAGINYGFGGIAADDLQAASNQAIDIIRRRTGRTDLQVINSWVPHLFYGHLVLADYLQQALPAPGYVSPGDHNRLAWQRNPATLFCQLTNRPNVGSCGPNEARWPYSSSYEQGIAFWCPDGTYTGPNGTVNTVSQASTHFQFTVPSGVPFGRRLLSEVTYPSQKAMVWEQVQRFYGKRELFFAYAEARVPVMFVDGSVSVRNTQDCNNGFNPNTPSSPSVTNFAYTPDPNWEPPTANGAPSENVIGHMRWTRTGIRGRDFGGAEVPWSPPP